MTRCDVHKNYESKYCQICKGNFIDTKEIEPALRYVYKDSHSRCYVCDWSFPENELTQAPDGALYCPEHWLEVTK